MGTIIVQTIVDKAEIILQDTTNVRWAATELTGWFNDGQREIVTRKPDAYVISASMALADGTRQTLPAAAIQLIDVPQNMGTDGATPGSQITHLDRFVLDNVRPDWHNDTAQVEIEHFCFDDRDRKVFWNYPPSDGTGQVRIIYVAMPADILIGAAMTLDDVYANALLDYILYRAFSKDSDAVGNSQRAQTHFNLFLNAIGVKDQVESAGEPA